MRYRWIDGLKGFAVLVIILIHFENWTHFFSTMSNPCLSRMVNSGVFGVEITYILNAFLLSRKIPVSKSEYLEWVGKRIIRIIPIYYVVLIASIILFDEYKVSAWSAISHFLLFSVMSPYWWADFPGTGYVSVLLLCQIFFPFYMKKIGGLKNAIIWAAIILSMSRIFEILFSRVQIISNASLQSSYFSYIFRGVGSFSLGAVLYYLAGRNEYIFGFSRKELLILFFSLTFLLFSLILSNKFDRIVFSCCFIFIAYICSLTRLMIIENPVFVFYGKHSFGIYLGHIFTYFLFAKENFEFKFFFISCIDGRGYKYAYNYASPFSNNSDCFRTNVPTPI